MKEDEIINKFWNEVIYNSNRNNKKQSKNHHIHYF